MPLITVPMVRQVDDDATRLPIREIASYLQETVGQRVAASLAGLSDAKQIGRYAQPGGPQPRDTVDLRLREGYKVVRTLAAAYDGATARAWLFGTNSRLDDEAPIELLRGAKEAADFRPVLRAARQVAMFDA